MPSEPRPLSGGLPHARVADKNADIGVIRVNRDVGRQSNLGFFRHDI